MPEHGTLIKAGPARVLRVLQDQHADRLESDLWLLAQTARTLVRLLPADPRRALDTCVSDPQARKDWDLAEALPTVAEDLTQCLMTGARTAEALGVREPVLPNLEGHLSKEHDLNGIAYARGLVGYVVQDQDESLPLVSPWPRVELLARSIATERTEPQVMRRTLLAALVLSPPDL